MAAILLRPQYIERKVGMYSSKLISPGQNNCQFPDEIFKSIFMNETFCILSLVRHLILHWYWLHYDGDCPKDPVCAVCYKSEQMSSELGHYPLHLIAVYQYTPFLVLQCIKSYDNHSSIGPDDWRFIIFPRGLPGHSWNLDFNLNVVW